MKDLKQLREKRTTAMAEANSLLESGDGAAFDAKMSEIENIDKDLERLGKFENLKQVHGSGAAGSNEPASSEETEYGQFSFLNFIKQAADGKFEGFEAEMIQEGRRQAEGSGVEVRGSVLPQAALTARPNLKKMNLRTGGRTFKNQMGVTTGNPAGTEGGDFVETVLSTNFIDLLYERLIFNTGNGLGATFFTDLRGDLEFPKLTRSSTKPAVKPETGTANTLEPGTASVKLTPNRLPALARITRQLINQGNISVEAWLRNYLATELAIVWQTDAVQKILDASGTYAVENGTNGGALTYAKVVEFETGIDDGNALMGNLGYLTNSKVRGALKTTLKAPSGSGADFIWESLGGGQNEVNNYRAVVSNIVPRDLTKGSGEDLSAMIFGNFADLYLGQWGGMQFLVNPYNEDSEGIIRINAFTFKDEQLAREESFAVSKDIDA